MRKQCEAHSVGRSVRTSVGKRRARSGPPRTIAKAKSVSETQQLLVSLCLGLFYAADLLDLCSRGCVNRRGSRSRSPVATRSGCRCYCYAIAVSKRIILYGEAQQSHAHRRGFSSVRPLNVC